VSLLRNFYGVLRARRAFYDDQSAFNEKQKSGADEIFD